MQVFTHTYIEHTCYTIIIFSYYTKLLPRNFAPPPLEYDLHTKTLFHWDFLVAVLGQVIHFCHIVEVNWTVMSIPPPHTGIE